MSKILLDLLLLFISAWVSSFAKSFQDELLFYYDKSIFYTWKHNKWFGSPLNTWNNKNFSKNPIIRWLFNGPFVFTTDIYHFADFFRNFTVPVTVSIIIGHPIWSLWYYLIFTTNFTIFFGYVWIKIKKSIWS